MTTDTNSAAVTPALTPEQRNALKQERTAAVRANYRHELSISYGPHPRHVLDIYRPKSGDRAPVLVFIHGGGWRNGAPANEGYLGGPLLGRGAMLVTLGYRLSPEGAYPHSCDDIERGLRWLHDHIAEHGEIRAHFRVRHVSRRHVDGDGGTRWLDGRGRPTGRRHQGYRPVQRALRSAPTRT